ncbi:MAG: hypothetical protein JWO98_2745 [Frankiales bacterium]|nr:hypothetical protein [Frankiales bacterium]
MESALPPDGYDVLVPLCRLGTAKTRLRLPDAHRRALALAMALDTVTAALRCPRVRTVSVICSDPVVRRAVRGLSVDCLAEEPVGGLNKALAYGAESIRGSSIAMLTADLPALTPAALTSALDAADGRPSFVPDAAGTGTVLLAVPAFTDVTPRFGPASAVAHRAMGAHRIDVPGLRALRRDVDRLADLADAECLGVGMHTRRVLSAIRHSRRPTATSSSLQGSSEEVGCTVDVVADLLADLAVDRASG